MSKKNLPDPELLRKLLKYNPDTGKLYWRERTTDTFEDGKRTKDHRCKHWNSTFSNKEAFTCNSHGYKAGIVLRQNHQAHRVIWAMYYGEWPENDIDHINGIRDDNRITNLRSVTRLENARNLSRAKNNTSGFTGVSWYKKNKKWGANIIVNKKIKFLGLFENINDAVKARKKAENEIGFHPGHGKVLKR